jgi:hypothetical protein
MMDLTQILVSLDGDTYRVGVPNLTEDEHGHIHGVQYHHVNGDVLSSPEPISFSRSQIVSDRPLRPFPNEATIYHFSRDDIISASEYARAGEDQLIRVTNHGLGSGIYGLYLSQEDAVEQSRRHPHQRLYPIPCHHVFYLEDAEHGNSLTQASKFTDAYVDYILASIGKTQPSMNESNESVQAPLCNQSLGDPGGDVNEDVFGIIQRMENAQAERPPDIPSVEGLLILWNNVLAREAHQIMLPLEALTLLLASYIMIYVSNWGRLIPEPITYLLVNLGFDSVIATDSYNNSFSRGCVRYCPFTDLPVSLQNRIVYTTRSQRPTQL